MRLRDLVLKGMKKINRLSGRKPWQWRSVGYRMILGTADGAAGREMKTYRPPKITVTRG